MEPGDKLVLLDVNSNEVLVIVYDLTGGEAAGFLVALGGFPGSVPFLRISIQLE